MDEEMWCSDVREYYLAIIKDYVLGPATTWRDLDNILLSKISQIQKAIYCMIPFI